LRKFNYLNECIHIVAESNMNTYYISDTPSTRGVCTEDLSQTSTSILTGFIKPRSNEWNQWL